MLSISKVESLDHGLHYYQVDNYYTNDEQENKGHTLWFGKAAEEFGFKGNVLSEDFGCALNGVSKNGKLERNQTKEKYISYEQVDFCKKKIIFFLTKIDFKRRRKKTHPSSGV